MFSKYLKMLLIVLVLLSTCSLSSAQENDEAPVRSHKANEEFGKARVRVEKHIAAKEKKVAKALRRNALPEDLPPLTWGDLANQTGYNVRDQAPWKDLAPLWAEENMNEVIEAMFSVPMPINYFTFDFILESRLEANSDTIDYSVKLIPEDFMNYKRHPKVQELATKSSQWKDILSYLEKFAGRGYHNELWMEFDQHTGPLAPSVFVGAVDWLRTLLMPKGLRKSLRSSPSVEDAVELLEPWIAEFWSPFWFSMPWLRDTQVEVRRKLVELIEAGKNRFSLYQIGFWLARDTGTVRLVLEDESHYDNPGWFSDTAQWWASTKQLLHDLGWVWTDTNRPNLLDEYMPQLLAGISHFFLAINLMATGVTPKVGFEMYFDKTSVKEILDEDPKRKKKKLTPESIERPRPDIFLDVLVKLGLCSEEKRKAALDGGIGGTVSEGFKVTKMKVGNMKFRTRVITNHIKVTFEPGKPVEAKLYSAAQYAWTNQRGPKKKARLESTEEIRNEL
mmetsp:Transcript_84449/g.176749  ORF Transcript_84449/g.176749 Transcript_84449/m.176749 type:complete len:505 (-) Transcript_84449:512-2026(-)|eukprot:CAMPEP_0206524382 /NCGR_PEP_ID=MMETSP0324_2-20121206/68151_1 /ASSEMBLY_ACC=CAM_ASM_000836 /TAXON_ID=2866 /ORGANISM="Crypthecodinium cohnii, Strain Seligo" /LENGTH=504 /DNA_ID=CAMNT_0054018939 /DNA_START=149 /DNA_END=1663 /DNA_ORIENTATION=-